MKTLKAVLSKPETLLIFIYLLIELSFLNLIPDVMMDEPWYSNTAYTFMHSLYFTNTNVGYSGGDLFCFSPFVIAVFFKLFGFSFWASRLSSVLAGMLTLLGLTQLLRELEIKGKVIFFTGLLLIFSNVCYVIFRTARPESWVLSFGMLSLLYAYRFYKTKKLKHSILSGVLAALSFLSHPYGILAIINSGFIILYTAIHGRKFSYLVYYGIAAIVVFSLPVMYCLANPRYSTFILFTEMAGRNSVTSDITVLENCRIFFTNYTLGIKRLYILFFEISLLFAGIFLLRKEKLLWIFPAVGLFNLVICLFVLSPFLTRGFGQVMIFSLISFALLLNTIPPGKISRVLLGLGFVYFLNNLAGDVFLLKKKINNMPYNRLVQQIDSHVPEGKAVASILEFWYAFPKNEFYCSYSHWYIKHLKNVEDLIASNRLDYIVLSNYLIRGYTPTTERVDPVDIEQLNYYNALLNYAKKSGDLIYEFDANNYGKVKIWKVKK